MVYNKTKFLLLTLSSHMRFAQWIWNYECSVYFLSVIFVAVLRAQCINILIHSKFGEFSSHSFTIVSRFFNAYLHVKIWVSKDMFENMYNIQRSLEMISLLQLFITWNLFNQKTPNEHLARACLYIEVRFVIVLDV